ncbi:uncharacterized transmembrane protein DDB_G0289901-like [Uranotaenia lowii]|uniref:uncharacterized transmembrane protein DDB_G0289901-like n=1 Tax=Uranotaenia lowii TaxID=190385 RepID=UPI0024786680|nr:uncharacterized transmembrane protein DDB_G0289901-like [Uranotaenia lowii]
MDRRVILIFVVMFCCLFESSEARAFSLRVKRQDIMFKTYEQEEYKDFADRMKPPPNRRQPLVPGRVQSSVANTGSQTLVNEHGAVLQQTAGASQSANLASDRTSGQLSAANTQQQSFQDGNNFQSQNSGQSQSANFGKEHQILSNANTNTNTLKQDGNIREQSEGGAGTSVVDKHGSQSSQAQTNSESFKGADRQGTKTSGSSQSLQIGNDGRTSGANSNTGSETVELADGSKITKSFSSSSSFQSSGGVKAGASASGLSSSG